PSSSHPKPDGMSPPSPLSLSVQILKSAHTRSREYSPDDLKALAAYVLAHEKVRGPVDLNLELTAPRRIQELNRRFRGVDRTTDVIAFRYGGKSSWEGDIA